MSTDIRKLLEGVSSGIVSVDEAILKLKELLNTSSVLPTEAKSVWC